MPAKPQRGSAQSGPFPGFSMDHFNYGMQMGMDGPGSSNHPWDSPNQNPYMSDSYGDLSGGMMGGGGGGMGGPQMAPGLMGMGQPQMDPSMGMDPSMMGGMPQGGGGGFPGQPDPSQPPGPSPTGVWGDQDLINDPAYSTAAATKHPKWNRFLQYMNTPEAKDSMMLGVIMSRMGVDPQGTLQLAMQFREHQAQRQFQAQQGELQREAQQENVKLRGEYMKEQKNEASQRTQGYKIDQARKDLANEGETPPDMPDDPAAWPVYQEDLRNRLGQAKARKLEEKKIDAKRKQAFSEAHKTGAIPDEFADDEMVQAAAQTAQDRKLRADERLDLQKSRESQLAKIRTNKATMPDVKLQAQNLHAKLVRVEKDIDRYEQNIAKIEGNGIYAFLPPDSAQKATFDRQIEAYQKRIEQTMEKADEYQTKWDDLVEVRGEPTADGSTSTYSPGTSMKDVAPPAAPAAAPAAGGTAAEPSPKAIKGYLIKASTEGEEAAKAVWDKYYKGKPYPKAN